MLKLNCDKCDKEGAIDFNEKDLIPDGWIVIHMSHFKSRNEHRNRSLIVGGGRPYHFCCYECFVGMFLFDVLLE